MEPSLHDGDAVEIDVDAKPRVGDVVLVLQHRSTVLHRVVALDSHGVITAGDAARFLDDRVSTQAVLGVARVPRRTWFARWRRYRRSRGVKFVKFFPQL